MDHYDENLSAILGPTNTGKTHLAFEKFLTYSSWYSFVNIEADAIE